MFKVNKNKELSSHDYLNLTIDNLIIIVLFSSRELNKTFYLRQLTNKGIHDMNYQHIYNQIIQKR